MNPVTDWWASLKHGGLLIAPNKIASDFSAEPSPLPAWRTEQLRRALTAFDGSHTQLGSLLDYLLQDLAGLPEDEWHKAQGVDSRWSLRSFTGALVKPRRVWQGPHGEILPLFVPEEGASRQFNTRLGVGRSKQLLSRVLEWLRHYQQPLALVTNGRQWRLVHAGQDYDAWCEWDIDLWMAEGAPGPQVSAWRQLISRDVLVAPSSHGQGRLLNAILASRKGQTELSAVLGERVRKAVEALITASQAAIEHTQQTSHPVTFPDLYVAGSRVIMRCIITLFAEARELLPVDHPIYQQAYSLEGLRQHLDRRASGRGNERLAQGRSAWPRLLALFRLIHEGSSHQALPVPQYSGALFAPGDAQSEDGIERALAILEGPDNLITDKQVQHILGLLTRTRMRIRQGRNSRWIDAPVDFSALSSEYIGILYEGLLDFELKQAQADNPVIFLGVGNEPALTLAQLESMSDATIENLFKELKKKTTPSPGADGGDEPTGDESENEASPEDDIEIQAEEDEDELSEEAADVEFEEEDTVLSQDHVHRTQAWLERAARLSGLVKSPRGRRASNTDEAQQALAAATKQLCARLVAPGQFYLVRWGGTRKGAGTFYTRPQLVTPTVRRTLQPLAFDVVRTETDPRTGLIEPTEWAPKPPQEILALKVCDPAMGSGSFLVGALRYLTDALMQSLFHHQLIERAEDGGVPRMADGQISALLSDELLKLRPDAEGFEDALRGQLKRHIVERCLYGVDLDPLAVELGRMALWVETMDRDLPFGFLDHKLKVGNALIGTWFDCYRDYPAMAWEREGGDKDYQKNKPDNLINHFYMDASNKKKGDLYTRAIKSRAKGVPDELIAMITGQLTLGDGLDASTVHEDLLKVFKKLHRLPVHEADKRAAVYRDEVLANPKYHALKARMDLWCALWFWPGEQLDLAPLPRDFAVPSDQVLTLASQVARERRFFHWELEFPDVFTATHTGFDAILGNPPWEIQKPNSKEFFSNHDPLYRAYGKQDALAKQLEYFHDRPALEHEWIAYNATLKAQSNWAKYVGHPFGDRVNTDKDGKKKHDLNLGGRGRDSFATSQRLYDKWKKQRSKHQGFADPAHPFVHQGSADLNTYKMFLEFSHALLHPEGRLGMIVPSGIYTDKGTTDLRTLFLERCDWQWLFGFENRDKVFDIDSRFKFCPLILQKGGSTTAIRAAFMHRNVDDWAHAEDHVLAYPRERVLEFSPYSKAILEIRSPQDLAVLQKIYANGVLLGDQSERGWGVKYAREFDMTNDSKLFPPRPKWEAKGYQPDEYGHWLKGAWHDYNGPKHILDREPGLVLSRDERQAIHVDQIEDVSLPLYEGRMIGQFDFSEKGWVSGKGRKAVWEPISFDKKFLNPQYLMSRVDFLGDKEEGSERISGLKVGFLAIGSATNSRSMFSGLVSNFPAGNSVAVLQCTNTIQSVALMAALNSFTYDFTLRVRLGGLNLNYFVVAETPTPALRAKSLRLISELGLRLGLPNKAFAEHWMGYESSTRSWHGLLALTPHERTRLKAINEATCAQYFGLDLMDFATVLENCDLPQCELIGASTKQLNPKGFWRIDKDKDPELRHTVLSLVAFHDLQEKGLDAFLAQNEGEGWLIPEQLRLADYGLGHDDRAKEYQPVASRLGPRFLDWQLNEDVARSWQECAAHAALIRKIVPLPEETAHAADAAAPTERMPSSSQTELF